MSTSPNPHLIFLQAVVFSVNTYNVNEGTLTMLQVTYNLDITGHIEMFYRLQTILPSRDVFYCDTTTKSIMLFLWYVWMGVLVADEAKKIALIGIKQHIKDGWSRMEFVFFALFFNLNRKLVIFHVTSNVIEDSMMTALSAANDWMIPDSEYRTAETAGIDSRINMETTQFVDLADLRGNFRDLQTALAFFGGLSALKFFKYFRFSLRLNLLWRVVDMAVFQLMNFIVIIGVLLLSISFLCVTSFGASVRGFHNVPSAMMTMVHMSTGDVEWAGYADMKRADPTLAPAFITLYVFIFIIVILNMFVAILMDAYGVARDEMNRAKQQEKALNEMGSASAFHHDIKTNYTLTDVLVLLFRLFRPSLAIAITFYHGDDDKNIQEGVKLRVQFSGSLQAKTGPTKLLRNEKREDVYAKRLDIATDLRVAPMHSMELRSAQFLSFLRPGDQVELRDAIAGGGNLHILNAKFEMEYVEQETLQYRTSIKDASSSENKQSTSNDVSR